MACKKVEKTSGASSSGLVFSLVFHQDWNTEIWSIEALSLAWSTFHSVDTQSKNSGLGEAFSTTISGMCWLSGGQKIKEGEERWGAWRYWLVSFGDPWLVITAAASELQSGRFWVQIQEFGSRCETKKGCFQKYGFFPPNHPFVHRVFHYFHRPFWGTFIFGNTQEKPQLLSCLPFFQLWDTQLRMSKKCGSAGVSFQGNEETERWRCCASPEKTCGFCSRNPSSFDG